MVEPCDRKGFVRDLLLPFLASNRVEREILGTLIRSQDLSRKRGDGVMVSARGFLKSMGGESSQGQCERVPVSTYLL
jgi:hypothetical protein